MELHEHELEEKDSITLLSSSAPRSTGPTSLSSPHHGHGHDVESKRYSFLLIQDQKLAKQVEYAADVVRYIGSSALTIYTAIVIINGIDHAYYLYPMPVGGCYILLILMLFLVYYLEGLMICVIRVKEWDAEQYKSTHPIAYKIEILMHDEENMKLFIVGRQFLTVFTTFIIAQLTVFPYWPQDGVIAFILFKSGFSGAVITLSLAQLLPELLAAQYPLEFLNQWVSYGVVMFSLLCGYAGIGHCSSLLASFVHFVVENVFKHVGVAMNSMRIATRKTDSDDPEDSIV